MDIYISWKTNSWISNTNLTENDAHESKSFKHVSSKTKPGIIPCDTSTISFLLTSAFNAINDEYNIDN